MTKEDMRSFSYRISQASRTELIVIMFDMAKQYIDDAMAAYKEENIEEFHSCLKQAKRVIDALSSSLDMQYSISAELFSIYRYAARTLGSASMTKNTDGLHTLCRVIGRLRASFCKAAKSDTEGPLMDNAQKVYAGLTYSNGRLNEVAYDLRGNANRGFTV